MSTIIPVYNRSVLLREAVASVLAQTYRPIEILIVDDGSTDDTAAVCRELAAAHAEITVLRQENAGAGAARERGRLAARGEFIQYLDSDDRLLPRKFEVQVAALRAQSDAGIAYGITRLIEESGAVLISPYKWTGRPLERLLPALLVDRWWNTHTPLYRRSICDAVGPWGALRMSEDWEYEARIAALGVPLVWCDEALSDTRQHAAARLSQQGMTAPVLEALSQVQVALWTAAVRQQIDPRGREVRHFGRWAFLVARQAAEQGAVDTARRSLNVARAASRHFLRDRLEVSTMAVGAALIGWLRMGLLMARVVRLRGRGPSARSQALARMQQTRRSSVGRR